jgi:hypothetical protein
MPLAFDDVFPCHIPLCYAVYDRAFDVEKHTKPCLLSSELSSGFSFNIIQFNSRGDDDFE